MTKAPYVLIVEDDDWLAEQYERTLAAAGMQTEHVPHAFAAMDATHGRLPNVILLDVMLPGPNAFTLLHELRSHTDLAAIPVILCTNNAELLAGEDLASYGVAQLLDKTKITPNDMVAAVKKVLP